jgi:hypothetical protein
MAYCDVEIGLTIENLFALGSIGVPNPDNVVYAPCVSEKLRGNLTWQRSGYKMLTLSWSVIHENELHRLITAIFPNESIISLTMFVHAPVTSGMDTGSNKRRLFQCTIKRPNLSGEDGKPLDLTLDVYDNVILKCIVVAEEITNFTADRVAGIHPFTIAFTDLSIGIITAWHWTFGDGGTSDEQNPSHLYTVAGVYDVALTTVGPDRTGTKTRVDYITIRDPLPLVANFSANCVTGNYPMSIQFTDLTTYDPERPILTWLWDFGDTETSVAQNPSHTYDAAGVCDVSLTVTCLHDSDVNLAIGFVTIGEAVIDYQTNVLSVHPDNLIAYWPFNDNPCTTVAEELIGGYDAVLSGVTMFQDGIGDGSKSIRFASVNANAKYQCLAGEGLDSAFNGNLMTLMLWVKGAVSDAWSNGMYLGCNMVSLFQSPPPENYSNKNYLMVVRDWYLNSVVDIRRCPASTGVVPIATNTWAENWHCLVIVVDVANALGKIYVDGVLEPPYAWQLLNWPYIVGAYNLYEVLFGRTMRVMYYYNSDNAFFNGYLAHVALWDCALSAEEVAGLAVETGYWY